MAYKVIIKPSAEKTLSKLPIDIQVRIGAAIELLSLNPYPPRAKKLVDRPGFRIRIGDYRIIYSVENLILTIYIVSIGHRKNIYH